MSSEKIALILDTNILRRSENFVEDMSTLSLEAYEGAINMIEINDLVDRVNIFIPEIVLLELSSQRLSKMEDELRKLEKISKEFDKVPGIEINVHDSFDSQKHIENIKISLFEDVNHIKMPENWGVLFTKVLEMALDKIPPFEKGQSDKGFKDALILLSLINFAKNEDYTKFILFSFDNSFKNNKKTIQEFFNKETSKTIEIERTKDIQGYLSNKYSLFMDLKDYLNDYFFLDVEDEIKENEKIFLEDEDIVCDIEKFEIDKENTVIKQVSENEYEISVGFEIICNCKHEEKRPITDAFSVYDFKKENETWNVKELEGLNYRVF